MTLFELYMRERHGYNCYSDRDGFVMYKIEGPVLFIGEFFVSPNSRNKGHAKNLAQFIENVAAEEKCEEIVANVWAGAPMAEAVLKLALGLGYTLKMAQNNCITISKKVGV